MAIFEYGVASGDPLTDRVVIWTRVESDQPSAEVTWVVARDQAMTDVVATGTATAQARHDHTVHVDPQQRMFGSARGPPRKDSPYYDHYLDPNMRSMAIRLNGLVSQTVMIHALLMCSDLVSG